MAYVVMAYVVMAFIGVACIAMHAINMFQTCYVDMSVIGILAESVESRGEQP